MDARLSAAESLNTAVAGVLGRMAVGVFATLVAAAVINTLGLVPVLFSGILGYVIMFAPLAMSLFLAFKGPSMSESTIKAWYFAFAAVMGVSLSLILILHIIPNLLDTIGIHIYPNTWISPFSHTDIMYVLTLYLGCPSKLLPMLSNKKE